MTRLLVKVSMDTFGTHTHQIFCGLKLLESYGVIDLKYVAPPSWLRRRPSRQLIYLVAQFEDGLNHHFYDLNDSAKLAHPEAIDHCHFYHKRSFSRFGYGEISGSEKLVPLGFNYQVNADSFFDYCIRVAGDFIYHPYNFMSKSSRPHIKNVLMYGRDLMFRKLNSREMLSHYEIAMPPRVACRKKLLFQCRLWDPSFFPSDARESISLLNSTRIDTVAALSKAFPDNFVGGLQPNDYAWRVAKEYVVRGPTNRKAYLRMVDDASVVVTSNGISDSIGWKMGEFVAAAKAIVCEPLQHTVPGNFAEGEHYLAYESPAQCVEKCGLVLENEGVNSRLTENCFNYYNRYARPDMLVFNSLMRQSTSPRI